MKGIDLNSELADRIQFQVQKQLVKELDNDLIGMLWEGFDKNLLRQLRSNFPHLLFQQLEKENKYLKYY